MTLAELCRLANDDADWLPCTHCISLAVIDRPALTFDADTDRWLYDDRSVCTPTEAESTAFRSYLTERYRQRLIAALKAQRNTIWQGGAAYGPYRMQTDPESIANLTGSYSFGKETDSPETPFQILWSLGQGNSVLLGLTELRQAAAIVFGHVQQCVARYLELHNALTTASTPEQLAEIQPLITTGWPS